MCVLWSEKGGAVRGIVARRWARWHHQLLAAARLEMVDSILRATFTAISTLAVGSRRASQDSTMGVTCSKFLLRP